MISNARLYWVQLLFMIKKITVLSFITQKIISQNNLKYLQTIVSIVINKNNFQQDMNKF